MWNSIINLINHWDPWEQLSFSQGGGGSEQNMNELMRIERSNDVPITTRISDGASNHTSDPREEDWPTEDSLMVVPDFSNPMSDYVSEEYQTKEMGRARRATEGSSDESDK